MNYKEIGQKILEAVGGKENVQNLTIVRHVYVLP